jgi:hypothetical protein
MDELNRLIVEYFEYAMTDVHTALPGVVVKYDPQTRRADVQPSLTRKLPGEKFLKFPVIPDVPVMFPGSKKYTLHFPLEEGDEVLLIVTERALLDAGRMEYEDLRIAYQSWRGNYMRRFDAWYTVQRMDSLYDTLFINKQNQ